MLRAILQQCQHEEHMYTFPIPPRQKYDAWT